MVNNIRWKKGAKYEVQAFNGYWDMSVGSFFWNLIVIFFGTGNGFFVEKKVKKNEEKKYQLLSEHRVTDRHE